MTIARFRNVDLQCTRWYHCIGRCVRKAFLLADEVHDRKSWIDNRLKQLEAIFAISVGGFSNLDNHLHLLLRVDPDIARDWSDHEVATRWLELYPSIKERVEHVIAAGKLENVEAIRNGRVAA